MQAVFVQAGDIVSYTPASAVSQGDVVIVGALRGVAVRDIGAGQTGAIAVGGVWSLAKGSAVFAVGDVVYWDTTSHRAGTSGVGIGIAVAAAASAASTVTTLLVPTLDTGSSSSSGA